MKNKYNDKMVDIIIDYYEGNKINASNKLSKLIELAETEGNSDSVKKLKEIFVRKAKLSISSSEDDFTSYINNYYFFNKDIKYEFDQIVNGGNMIYHKFLLHGEPGLGKTEFVERISKELGINILKVSYSTLLSPRLGDTLKNINDLIKSEFDALFFDEFDAIAVNRNTINENEEVKRANIEIMRFLDEVGNDKYVFAATNIKGKIDEATVRRFDKEIEFIFSKEDSYNMFSELRNKFKNGIKENRKTEISALLTAIQKSVVLLEKKPFEIKRFFEEVNYFYKYDKKNIGKIVLNFMMISHRLPSKEIEKKLISMGFSKTNITFWFREFINND